jgi:hypothetical protein
MLLNRRPRTAAATAHPAATLLVHGFAHLRPPAPDRDMPRR